MSKDKNVKEVTFVGRPQRCIYNGSDFKVYAFWIDKDKYPEIHMNKYKNVSVVGELHELTLEVEYEVKAIEEADKYGYSYKVQNIRRNLPTTPQATYAFLSEILTARQAQVLYETYPDIVQRVKENRLDDVDLNKLKGIKERTFNVIKKKIIENFVLADLIVEFQGYLNLSIVKKLYNEYSSIEKIKYELQKNPYKSLCNLGGIGFKTADSILLKIEEVSKKNISEGKEPIIRFNGDLRSSSDRCLAFVIYTLEENENEGNTKANLADIRKMCIDTVAKCADKFVEVIKSPEIYYNKETMDIALKRTYNTEKKIADVILENVNNTNNVWDFETEHYRNVNGFDLTDDQMKILTYVCKYPISILNGFGGAGKTMSTRAVVQMLQDHYKSVLLMSPTGKAAKVLAENTKREAKTIHRGLQYTPSQPNPWHFNAANKLNYDVVIVDEFSMADIYLFNHLIDAIDFDKTKLLIVGDNAQLTSVGAGNLLHDFMESKIIPTVTLNQIFRYGEGGLMRVATDTRNCKPYLNSSMKSKATSFGSNKDYTFVDISDEHIPDTAVALYKKLLDKGNSVEDIQVLTAKNVGDCGTVVLNNKIQQVANPNYGSEINMKVGETTYYVGDLIMQKQNNYHAPLEENFNSKFDPFIDEESEYNNEEPKDAFIANGDIGKIIEIANSYVVIDFDGVVVRYQKEEMSMAGLSYCCSIHKSQGSSIKNVIVCSPQSHVFMLNSNLLYVALTRMRESCYQLGSIQTINNAVRKKANLSRNTFMQQLLQVNNTDNI